MPRQPHLPLEHRPIVLPSLTRARGFLVEIWTNKGAGRLLVRPLLLGVVAIPRCCDGAVLAGYALGLFGAAVAIWLAALGTTIFVTAVVLFNAARLVHLDAERLASRTRLREVLDSSTAVTYATKIVGADFVPNWVSENITRMMGYRADEALFRRGGPPQPGSASSYLALLD